MPPLASIGIDIGKEVFHIVGFSTDGRIAFCHKIKRLALVETFKKLPPSAIGMEACLSAHWVSRALRQLDHEPRIIPAIYVKPAEPAYRAREDARSARPPSLPSRSLPPGLAPNSDDQSDPCFPYRARHRSQDRSKGLTQLAQGNFKESPGRDIAADERPDCRPLRGLDCAR
jgi:hypothetical protein